MRHWVLCERLRVRWRKWMKRWEPEPWVAGCDRSHFGPCIILSHPRVHWATRIRQLVAHHLLKIPRGKNMEIPQFLARQSARPSGLLGRYVMGWLLHLITTAHNALVLDELVVSAKDRVLSRHSAWWSTGSRVHLCRRRTLRGTRSARV